jgi:hypothetical protein
MTFERHIANYFSNNDRRFIEVLIDQYFLSKEKVKEVWAAYQTDAISAKEFEKELELETLAP